MSILTGLAREVVFNAVMPTLVVFSGLVTSWLQDQPYPHGKVKRSVQRRRGMQSQTIAAHGDTVAAHLASLQVQ